MRARVEKVDVLGWNKSIVMSQIALVKLGFKLVSERGDGWDREWSTHRFNVLYLLVMDYFD